MKQLVIIISMIVGVSAFAQEDRFKFNVDLTVGFVSYTYDNIENGGYAFSNTQWEDTLHSLSFGHVYRNYIGLNTVIHGGLHIPIIKGKMFSFGVRPKVGIGRLFQVSPKPSEVVDDYGWEVENDPKRITSMTFDATALAYARYNLFPKHIAHTHIAVLFGYRFLRSNDNYSTPIVAAEFGNNDFSIGAYTHLFRMNYYREFSDGSQEVAKSFHEFGLTFNYLIDKKEKPIKNEEK
jgi:hypothetical protein